MPRYDYKCKTCDTVEEMVTGMDEYPDCPECGEKLKRLISNITVTPDLQPYFDENICPGGAYVKSKQHRMELCEQHGVTPCG